ncbi:sensor histidine kinase [Leptospira brenneri]|uniref:histidine kinase n=1 Tax=Leptospira brenneri TaxID=2023182 RepID=A0A2M9Y2W7_9LEPT|nr:HAMP domain-containing sensor histidine kinase [Leptospira brenneri]PJZ45918.1 two-component sensor histidine kinase [Leptospira brenneri]TGK91429.1 sensor histidine kinase [Leptospira brenneri]
MFFSLAWLFLTLSLGVWWWILGFRQAKTISEISISAERQVELDRVNRMLQLEGSFFLSMLTLGGVTLAVLSYRDHKRSKLISDFFSTVTHEMKTPIASLQLQIEVLLEGTKHPELKRKLEKIWKENQRIESQMGNAFYLASLMQGESLYLETLTLTDLRESYAHHEPDLHWNILIPEKSKVHLDKKAFFAMLKNLSENAKRHGKAKTIKLTVTKEKEFIHFLLEDDGNGFVGNKKNLTLPFLRHSKTSGSGIGLYIVKKLIEKMKGSLEFPNSTSGFQVKLILKEVP